MKKLTDSQVAALRAKYRALSRSSAQARGAEYDWYNLLAHKHQKWPLDDCWTAWLLIGGRGAGKTRAGAEWLRDFVRKRRKPARVALVSETYADGREVMIGGLSGLSHIGPVDERPVYEPSRRRLYWKKSGSVGYVFSSEDPDGLRGHQFDAAWADELCKWKHAEETWSNLQLALRLGDRPRQAVTTTPRPTALLKRIIAAPTTRTTRATTYDNAEYLSRAFLDEIAAAYEGTRLGRQELLGEIVEDVAGALWTYAMIEASRISPSQGLLGALDRVVVAVDPPVSAGERADECGIVVAGVMSGIGTRESGTESEDGRTPDPDSQVPSRTAFILADRSEGGLSPRQWAAKAVAAYHEFKADRMVVETNQGGDMVREIVRGIDPTIAIRDVRATRGKKLRAEPVAALYEQGLVRHVGAFPTLEDQMTSFTGEGARSPDRLDALVWALTDLMLRPRTEPRIKQFS
jgi:phage terminase large subunit-like protein